MSKANIMVVEDEVLVSKDITIEIEAQAVKA